MSSTAKPPRSSLFSEPAPAPTTAVGVVRQIATNWLKLVLALTLIAVGFDWRPNPNPEHYFLWRQDLPVLAGEALVIALLMLAPRLAAVPADRWLSRRWVWLAALAALMICGMGSGLVFDHYHLSMDEALADFDAAIFRQGAIMAPVAPEWRAYVPALQPYFMIVTEGHAWWSSSYLPGNALLRAAADVVGAREWLNPVLSAVAILATYGVGRSIWPGHPRRAVAAALLLASSAQFLVMGMSAYAMPAHLALNMIWLWLFLRQRTLSDLGALGVGFAATGLHQIAFHPLFAGPFILELLIARRWRRAALFIGGYALICLFWVAYWKLVYRQVGLGPEQTGGYAGASFWRHALDLLATFNAGSLGLMAESLVRFVSWQNIVLAPLALIGGLTAWRQGGPLRPMAVGVVVACLFYTVLIPTQIHGWGYRYLHGMLGTCALLAVGGWVSLVDKLDERERQTATRIVATLCLVSLIVLPAVRAVQARAFSQPFAVANAAIQNSEAEFVLVDNGTAWFDAGTIIRNDPWLKRSPKVFWLSALAPNQLDDLCRRGRVRVFDSHDPAAKGIQTFVDPAAAKYAEAQRARMRQQSCGG